MAKCNLGKVKKGDNDSQRSHPKREGVCVGGGVGWGVFHWWLGPNPPITTIVDLFLFLPDLNLLS